MGTAEERVADSIRRTKVNTAVMQAVAAAGVITLAAVAPNALRLLSIRKFIPQREREIRGVAARLARKGYLEFKGEDGAKKISLTERGRQFMYLLEDGITKPEKPKRWDGKWRVLTFDIPERRAGARRRLRSFIAMLGFVRLQDSVWVYPFPCEEAVTALKAELRLGNAVRYLIADHIENDRTLREHFTLPAEK